VKKPQFNNARVIIVLAQQKRWATCYQFAIAVRETAKQPQFNSARAIIVLAEQKQL